MARVPHWKPIRGPKEYTLNEYLHWRFPIGTDVHFQIMGHEFVYFVMHDIGKGWRRHKESRKAWKHRFNRFYTKRLNPEWADPEAKT